MLTMEHMHALADTMVANGITELAVAGEGYAVRLARAPVAGTSFGRRSLQITSPEAGVFHPRGGDDGFAELHPGALVRAAEPLGYVGFGPVRVLCISPVAGRLVGYSPVPGAAVNAGDVLFRVEPEA